MQAPQEQNTGISVLIKDLQVSDWGTNTRAWAKAKCWAMAPFSPTPSTLMWKLCWLDLFSAPEAYQDLWVRSFPFLGNLHALHNDSFAVHLLNFFVRYLSLQDWLLICLPCAGMLLVCCMPAGHLWTLQVVRDPLRVLQNPLFSVCSRSPRELKI